MQITRRSQMTGVERTLDIDVTAEQIDAWQRGALIQDAMPHLSVDDREFIKTGVTAEEWDQAFSD